MWEMHQGCMQGLPVRGLLFGYVSARGLTVAQDRVQAIIWKEENGR